MSMLHSSKQDVILIEKNERVAGNGRTTGGDFSSHNWPDDLIDIVNEPMGQTLDRMKKYSNSLSQVDRGTNCPRLSELLIKLRKNLEGRRLNSKFVLFSLKFKKEGFF
ncbi:unnamed protein product [Onchocerca flexuosa]|uniref:Uncharacterized protein n=1 Tax=Onchocerca flexuosa TaxID=387005 RepID=A0A183HRY8_9BILA|nr:unnamed protein product [Onchocerca flexuosa]